MVPAEADEDDDQESKDGFHSATQECEKSPGYAETQSVPASARENDVTGFFRRHEQRLAVRLLAWQYERQGLARPPSSHLEQEASRIVDDAHRIARDRGRNILSVIRELVADLRKGP